MSNSLRAFFVKLDSWEQDNVPTIHRGVCKSSSLSTLSHRWSQCFLKIKSNIFIICGSFIQIGFNMLTFAEWNDSCFVMAPASFLGKLWDRYIYHQKSTIHGSVNIYACRLSKPMVHSGQIIITIFGRDNSWTSLSSEPGVWCLDQKGDCIFQPLRFRSYVSFREGTHPVWVRNGQPFWEVKGHFSGMAFWN